MTVLASFIVPVYKVEECYLRECIESIKRIHNKDIEIILIDDGSPDNCGEVCDEYSRLDSRIKSIHKNNEGVSATRNYGVSIASGKYLTFVDADDWLDSQVIENILQVLEKNNYDIVLFGQYIDFKNSTAIEVRLFNNNFYFNNQAEVNKLKKMVFVRDYNTMKTHVGAGVVCNAVDKFIKRNIIINNNLKMQKNISIGEDNLFYLQLYSFCKDAYYIDMCAYHYRMRQTSANNTNSKAGYDDLFSFIKEAKSILKLQYAPTELYRALDYRCYDLLNEQLYRSYLMFCNSIKDTIKMAEMFRSEMSKNKYFESAVSNIDLKDYKIADKIKLFLLKTKLYRVFFFIVYLRRKIGSNNDRQRQYY